MKHIPLIEYHLTNHCNLNCKGCAHFAPLAKPWFAEVEDFKRDLTLLSKKVIIDELTLFGGEPLLHPKVGEFCKIAREVLPNTKIGVLTNGIDLLKKLPELKNVFVENDIVVDITAYPISVNYKMALKLLSVFGIKYKIYNDLEPVKTLRKHKLSHTPKENDWDCLMIRAKSVQLKDGKLYLCPIQAYIDIFNDYFGETFVVDEKDILTLTENTTAEEITGMYYCKNDFCKYCREPIEGNKYSTSRKEKSEWM